jgi:nucleotide-binding universal stress UspA family protein
MSGFHHILFPVDFSEPCRAVYPFVKTMAARFGAKITLLNAVFVPPGIYGSFATTYPVMIDVNALQQDAQRQLAAFADTSDEGTTLACPIGEPAQAIVDHVENFDVDLIMMPTHGHGLFRGLLLGSVAAKVLHDTTCAVWTAAHTNDPQLSAHLSCRSIVVAVDTNKEGVCVVKRTMDLAGLFNAKLHLVHAVPAAMPHSQLRMDADYRHLIVEDARVEVAKMQQRAGSDLPITVEASAVSQLVQKVATQQGADLVIIGRGKQHATLGRLRTHAYGIIRDSPCPVLSL